MDLEKILVVIDPELDNTEYLKKVAQLATATGAMVELYNVVFNSSLHDSYLFNRDQEGQAIASFLKSQEPSLEKISYSLAECGIRCGYDLDWSKDLGEAVVKKAQAFDAQLVMLSSVQEPGSYLLNLGKWKLISQIDRPLLLVKDHKWATHPRVAAAIDPFHESEQAEALDQRIVTLLKAIESPLSAEMHLVHTFTTVPQSVIFNEHIALDFNQLKERIREQHTLKLSEFVNENGLQEAQLHLKQGEFHMELKKLQEEAKLDIVVMGSIARGAVDRLLIGSSTERVFHEVDADLLLVK
jgi:universal stress protein E